MDLKGKGLEMKKLSVNGAEYEIEKFLGKGKGGYSYLVFKDGRKYVLKQIHHEPCSYYQFDNKIPFEIKDYKKLFAIGIQIPIMINVDIENERIIKEYIEGNTIYKFVISDKMKLGCIEQVREICKLLYPLKINIDYFSFNFVVSMEEWNFENWGIKYWSKTPEFLRYFEEHK